MYPKFNYPWQRLVFDTFMGLRKGLQSKANKAERAICERLRDPTLTVHERTALHDALRKLQLLFPQNSKQQGSGEMKNIRAGLLPRTRASAAKSRVVEQFSTSETAKVLQIRRAQSGHECPVRRGNSKIVRDGDEVSGKGFSNTCGDFVRTPHSF